MQRGNKKLKKLLATGAIGLGLMLMIPAEGPAMSADDAPESIEIDVLSEFYGPVSFDHAMHIETARCSDCHHHTTGTGPANPNCARCHDGVEEGEIVSCSGCHNTEPFTRKSLKKFENPNIYHINKPGLKGAYHLNCVGCHQSLGAPTGCRDCHEMNQSGERLFHTGTFTPAGYLPVNSNHHTESKRIASTNE